MTAELAARPPASRYDFIKTWVLPSGEREDTPAGVRQRFRRDSCRPRASARGPSRVSTFGLLIDSARAAGQLDALATAVRPLVEQKTAHAETLALMIDLARGRSDDARRGCAGGRMSWRRRRRGSTHAAQVAGRIPEV